MCIRQAVISTAPLRVTVCRDPVGLTIARVGILPPSRMAALMSWVRARSIPRSAQPVAGSRWTHALPASVSNCPPPLIDEPQRPRRQERAIVRLVRRLFCFDQLARARPAAPCPAEAPRSLSARGHATPPRAARTPMCVVRQHARRPPFRLVRGSVADPSADMRARGKGKFELK